MTVTHRYLAGELERTSGSTLAEHMRTQRAEGMTWQQIADDLHERTGVLVSRETLRQWFPELQKEGAR